MAKKTDAADEDADGWTPPAKSPESLGRRPPGRSRRSKLPKPPEQGWAPGSKTYLPEGELMQNALVRSDAWREIWLPFLEAKEKKWGAGRLYSLLELERLSIAAVEEGQWYRRRFRTWLSGDGGRLAREHLDLVAERMTWRDGVVNSLNVPSEATLSRARNFISWEERAALARATFERLRDEALAMPEFAGADEVLYTDGFDVFITGRPPKGADPTTPEEDAPDDDDHDIDLD